ncbi:MAG: hypothetical protein B6U88_00835 [Candidatus Aenigmarchaeota archaeon ex4484_56]|nr:MAG: hypothetical protein B6U88_00835 [Candidatus Aenigmarchaeota archaeon ex4484_56]
MEYYPRKIEEKLDKWLKRREIILIKGPRQSGKTTLLLHLNEKLNGNYVTLEDEDIKLSLENNPKEFAKRYLDSKFLFIDEAQYLKNIGKKLKLLFDLFGDKLKLIITGSGSFDIKVEVGKYLVGRAIYFELYPLTFEEFLLWKDKSLYKIFLDYRKKLIDFILKYNSIEKPVFEKEFYSLLEEYLIFGGFPAIVKEKSDEIKKELLKNLVRTYLEKDVFFFLGIRHLDKFRNLLKYLAFNIGSLLNISSIMQEFKIDYKTVEKYLAILYNTYIISLLPPFYRNLSTELKKSKKIYYIDIGLRNALIDNFTSLDKRQDKGEIYGNYIFNELKNYFKDVKYWRTTGKAEVDFVIKVNNEIVPVEVKSKTKLTRGFISFLKTYKPKRAIVFSSKEFGIRKIEKTKVAFVLTKFKL